MIYKREQFGRMGTEQKRPKCRAAIIWERTKAMGCAEKDCCTKGAATGAIAFPGTNEPNTPWKLYNHLIAGIPCLR